MASHEQTKRDQDILDRIAHDFTNHPPRNGSVASCLDELTTMMIDLAKFIAENVPAGREQALALTNLEQSSMWCKAGIARNQDFFDQFENLEEDE